MGDRQAILDQLTGPGGAFEIAEEDVRGQRLPVFKRRLPSLRALLDQSLAHGDKEYLVHRDRRIGYAEHHARVGALAAAFRERYGLRPGDRVAILAANCAEWVLALWATVSSGGVVAALNGWWQRDEILYGLEHSQPSLLIGDARRLERLAGHDPGVPVLETDAPFAALEAEFAGASFPQVELHEDDPAVILYTSGTSGRSKGAVGSHRGILGFAQLSLLSGLATVLWKAQQAGPDAADAAETPSQPSALVTAPLFHLSALYGAAVTMLAVGGKTVYRDGRFDPEDVLRLIERERVTTWSALGSMPHQVLAHPAVARYDTSSLNMLGSGGAPTSPEIQRRLRDTFPRAGRNMGLGYGLSESVTAVTAIGGDELAAHPTSVGGPNACHEIEIRDGEGHALPAGQQGEIHVRSPYLMLGYWRDPEATREALLPGGWLRTGDIGHLEDGRLYVNSRARDLILRGGENVYPVEIEQRLDEHAQVAEAAVIGVDHAELGQEVKAIVVPAEGCRPDPEALARFVGEKLAAFKVPAHWELRTEPLPRNAAGKVLKSVLTGERDNPFVEE